MSYRIRAPQSEDDGATLSSFSILTILETLPETHVNPSIAPNFPHEAMASMYKNLAPNPQASIPVGHHRSGQADGARHLSIERRRPRATVGYLFTRHVLPQHRRQGLGVRLLDMAPEWFNTMEVD